MNPRIVCHLGAVLALGLSLPAYAELPDLIVQKVEYLPHAKDGACNTVRITVFNNSMTPVSGDIGVSHIEHLGEAQTIRKATIAGGIGGKTTKTTQLFDVVLATYSAPLVYVSVDPDQAIAESDETNNQLHAPQTIKTSCSKLAVADASAPEGKAIEFAVSLTPPTNLPVKVGYSAKAGSATGGASCGKGVDFVEKSGTLEFAPNEKTKTIRIDTCADSAAEGSETLTLSLERVQNAEIAKGSARGEIMDAGAPSKTDSFAP